MDVLHSEMLRLLIPWSLLIAWAMRGRRRRERHWEALGQSGRPPRDGAIGGAVAGLFLIVALMQPRWGTDPSARVPPGRDVVLLIDVSRSMGAEDAVPNRLGLAIEGAEGLLRAMGAEPGDRAAVVAFSGVGAVRCGLTENLGAAIDVVRRLRPGEVQPGGTDLIAGLDAAVGAFDDRDHAEGRMIVVFTDGEDLVGGRPERFGSLKSTGILVFGVAIGDSDVGHPVPSGTGPTVLSYAGKPVVSKRTDEPLKALAEASGGAFFPVGLASADMSALYRANIAPAAKRALAASVRLDRIDRSGLFLLIALFALTIQGRSRTVGTVLRRKEAVAAAVSIAIGLLVGAGPSADSPRALIERGLAAYSAKHDREALEAFEAAVRLAPDAAIPRFDAAAVLFRLGRYPEAIIRYREAQARGDRVMQAKADYGLGNTYLMGGDATSAVRHYDACIAASSAGSAIRRDAEINRDYVLRRRTEPPGAPSPPEKGTDPRSQPAPDPKPKPKPPDAKQKKASPQLGDSGDLGGTDGETSPERRLDSEIDRVREALKHRNGGPPPSRPATDIKDW